MIVPSKCSKAGQVKVVDAESKLAASTGSDVEVMQALRRRGVAYNLAAVMSFEKHEALIDLLFAEMQGDVMPGFLAVTFSQLQVADREIHVRLSEHTRTVLVPDASGGLPLDKPLVWSLRLPL